MGRNHGIQAGVRALSDATGLSPEEVWLTATAVALAAALAGLILNIDVVTVESTRSSRGQDLTCRDRDHERRHEFTASVGSPRGDETRTPLSARDLTREERTSSMAGPQHGHE